ncbi:HAD-IA family hydrolase [Rathayibacter sp. VKM Ac-2759]|nr:HAD-IA family hydrolase [Rathayibacter sp. VKM Ac-2759]
MAFDLDGTLVDHEGAATNGLHRWLRSLDATPTAELTAEWFRIEKKHVTSWREGSISWDEQRRQRLREFLPLIGRAVGEPGDLDRCFREGYLPAYEDSWTAYPDARPVLEELIARGFTVAIISNGQDAQQSGKLRRTGLAGLVPDVLTADGLGVAKPDPAIFTRACARLDVAPDAVLYVGDEYDLDVVAARAAGLRAVHLDRPDSNRFHEASRVTDLHQLLGRSELV